LAEAEGPAVEGREMGPRAHKAPATEIQLWPAGVGGSRAKRIQRRGPAMVDRETEPRAHKTPEMEIQL
jgi:hypothetical protein